MLLSMTDFASLDILYQKTRPKNNRAAPIEMIDERIPYVVKRYIELLTEACNSVTEPFGLKLALPPIPVSSLQSYLS